MQSQERPRAPALLVLRDGRFRTIWSSGVLIESSRRLELLVLSWFVLIETGSPFQLALIWVFANLPRPIFAVFFGVIADRFNRQHVLVLAQSLNVLTALGLLLLIIGDQLQPWHAFVAGFLQGTARSLDEPSRRTAVFDIVGARLLLTAMSLDSMTFTVGKIAGPLLGGLLLTLVGFTGAYGFTLALHLFALAFLVRLRVPESRPRPGAGPVFDSLMESVRYTLRSPVLMGLLYVTVLMNALAFPVQQFIPAIGKEHLGVGPFLVGLLAASEGFGQLLSAGIVATRRNVRYHGRVFVAGSLTALVMAVLLVQSPWYALSFGILVVGGFGQTGFGTMQTTILLLSSPPEMRGRLLGLLYICIGVGTPLGTLEIGAVAAVLSLKLAITVNALAGLVLRLPLVAASPLFWRPTQESPAEQPQAS